MQIDGEGRRGRLDAGVVKGRASAAGLARAEGLTGCGQVRSWKELIAVKVMKGSEAQTGS